MRTIVSVVILVAWGTGFSFLVRREFFIGSQQRLAEVALRISPGVMFYIVEQGGKQVGFASTTIDTLPSGIDVVDYFIADLPAGDSTRRASARSVVSLSRAFSVRTFDVQTESPATPRRVAGRAEGDTAIVYAVTSSRERPDSQRVGIAGPMLLPSLVPLAVALGRTPRVGQKYAVPVFNPSTTASGQMSYVVRAESLFALVDSATLDSTRGEWVRALADTVRAWRLEPAAPAASGDFSGWVDASGRVVQRMLPGGITVRRMVYEIAFENWRIARDRSIAGTGTHDILERTAVSAGVVPGRSRLTHLSVRLHAGDLRGYDLGGGRQVFGGDSLSVRQEADADLEPSWSLLKDFRTISARFRAELRDEPLLQVHDHRILGLAIRIAGAERDPRAIAERINRWVHDSIANRATFTVPNALAVLRTRKGDCNEHTQLAVALTRALGIPARAATGLIYVSGKFYYHAWPEVYLRDWVAMDPTFGQFPADAAHVRFVASGLSRPAELLRLIGNLRIDILDAK